eukprot:s4231_g12.t1
MVSPLPGRRVTFHGAPAEIGGGGFEPTALRIARINEQLAEIQALMQVTIHKLDSQQADSAMVLQRLRSRLLDSLKRLAALERNVGREQAECVKVMEAVLTTVERNGQVAEAVTDPQLWSSRKREAVMPSTSYSPFSSSPSVVGQLGRMLGAARTQDSGSHALGLPAGTLSAKAAQEDTAASATQRLHVENAPVPARLPEENDLQAEESAGPVSCDGLKMCLRRSRRPLVVCPM